MKGYKIHARQKGTTLALCSASGVAGGYHVVSVPPETWNNAKPELRCARCVAAVRRTKQRT
ncbi:hypothetical protein [Burkholderia multivorans]|uniref:hypothetical protein n=1 Tax=Burkholderia multivorans TaxID=87883 RepID=UPI000A95DB62|nr:hypothetical protein [Burkholderia multivorans]